MKKWNDLPILENIKDTFNLKKANNKNIEDFKESIYYFVEEYLKDNIRVYEDYHLSLIHI